jgi:hypothetical protein
VGYAYENLIAVLEFLAGRNLKEAERQNLLAGSLVERLLNNPEIMNCNWVAEMDSDYEQFDVSTPNKYKPSGKNGRHKRMYPRDKYEADRKQLQNELDAAKRTQSPGRKGEIKKIKAKLKHLDAKSGDSGENHSQRAKGGSSPGAHQIVDEDD